VTGRWLTFGTLLLSLPIIGANAGAEERDVAAESYRAGQDATLDLEVDFDALRYFTSHCQF
jgi:hypothetical protein